MSVAETVEIPQVHFLFEVDDVPVVFATTGRRHPRRGAEVAPAEIVEVFEFGARLLAESAPTMFISAPVVEVPPVVVGYVQPAPVVKYGTLAPTVPYASAALVPVCQVLGSCTHHVVRGSEFVFQPLHPETGAPMHVERVIAAAALMCILSSASEMSLLNVVTCETSCCMLVSQSFQEVFNVVWKLENTVPPVIVLSFTHLPRRTSTTWRCGKVQFWDQSCRQQDWVSAFGSGHWRTVARGACDCTATGVECAL